MIDLRDHIEALKERGELVTVAEEMPAGLDMSALAAMSNRAGTQAIHFTKPAGYPAGYTVAANLLASPGLHYWVPGRRTPWRRMAVGTGIDPDIDYESLMPILFDRYHHPILPVKVTSGPCKEEVDTGADVNLFKFPFPLLHKEDGGRYVTGVLVVKDLESDWQNWGVYRAMIVAPDRLVADFLSEPAFSCDVKAIYGKYAARNQPMPFAFALGGAPAIMIAAAQRLPSGMSEVEYAGGLNLDPINLITAETSELLVPSDAEIVIEGEVVPGEMVEEGPYGSIKGYIPTCSRPVMKVTAITHRKDPIVPIIVDGTKVSDTQAIVAITEASRLTRKCLEEHQDPIRWLQIPPEYNLAVCFASIMNIMTGIAFRLTHYIFGNTNLFDKMVILDSDVMPTGWLAMWNDFTQKCHAIRGHHVIENYPQAVMPSYGEKEPGKGSPRMYFDAFWPSWWPDEEKPIAVSLENTFPRELAERVVKRWKEEFKIPLEPFLLPPGQRR
jgi:4-hydroxy-3-polyprenylbenzoate decarboxylase